MLSYKAYSFQPSAVRTKRVQPSRLAADGYFQRRTASEGKLNRHLHNARRHARFADRAKRRAGDASLPSGACRSGGAFVSDRVGTLSSGMHPVATAHGSVSVQLTCSRFPPNQRNRYRCSDEFAEPALTPSGRFSMLNRSMIAKAFLRSSLKYVSSINDSTMAGVACS